MAPDANSQNNDCDHERDELLKLRRDLAQYSGYPKCMDCGWKLGTEITNNCGCCPSRVTPHDADARYVAAFKHARLLQSQIQELTDRIGSREGQP